jgi:uncharacterized phage protein (TIGR01671 family)
MAREIKFRGKRLDNGDWICGDLITGCATYIHEPPEMRKGSNYEMSIVAPPVDSYTLCEYTGLKDKNGKEIYESDIVECKMLSTGRTYYTSEYTAVVEQDIYNPCFVLKQSNGSVEYDFVKCDLMILEIIGDIWDNPELLKENGGV